jgi:broad specificity phosphatase PhoE
VNIIETPVLTLYIARHGQSDGQTAVSKTRRGERPEEAETGLLPDDWRLTPLGQQQAERLGERLKNTRFDVILCSELDRAQTTAREVLRRQAEPPLLDILPDLLEIGDYGEIVLHREERRREQIQRARRVAKLVRKKYCHGETVLIAAHGSLNNRLLWAFLHVPPHKFRFGQDNTGLTEIIFAGKPIPRRKRVRLLFLNDLSHLPPELRSEYNRGIAQALHSEQPTTK